MTVCTLSGSPAFIEVWPWFGRSARYVADRVPGAVLREVSGAGHMGVWFEPEAYAAELSRFFGERRA